MHNGLNMTTNIERVKLVEIYDVLSQIKMSFDEVQHRWKAVALRRQLKDTVEVIIETRDDSNKLMPRLFQEQRDALCRQLSMKDAAGAPIVAHNTYVINPENQADFDVQLTALRLKHKKDIDAYEAEVKRVNAFLLEEIELPTSNIRFKLSWFNKTVSQETLDVLFDFIDADDV
jgi:hypothetical protein